VAEVDSSATVDSAERQQEVDYKREVPRKIRRPLLYPAELRALCIAIQEILLPAGGGCRS